MTKVTFNNEPLYRFALGLADNYIAADENNYTITFKANDRVLKEQFDRLADGQACVLLHERPDSHYQFWFLIAGNTHALEYVRDRLEAFIVPTYAEYCKNVDNEAISGSGQIAIINYFDASRNDFQAIGADLFPTGYFLWRSPYNSKIETAILHGIELWNGVEKRSPKRRQPAVRTYLSLYSDFRVALTARQWDIATSILAEMKRSYRATWDNQRYLEVQMLAEQQDWEAIWTNDNFAQLARMTVPYQVRSALLTAFHYMNLQAVEREGRLNDAIAIYTAKRSYIVEQLTTRTGLASPPVLRLFAYESYFTQDRIQLEALRSDATDEVTKQIIEKLIERLPSPQSSDFVDTDATRIAIQDMLDIDDYDGALLLSAQLPNILDRVALWLEVAATSKSELLCQQAFEYFRSLSTNEQTRLLRRERHTARHLEHVQLQLNPSSIPNKNTIIDWIGWFEQAQDDPASPSLRTSLRSLKTVNPTQFWTTTYIGEISHQLLAFVFDDSLMKRAYAVEALTLLRDIFLEDEAFPRDSDEYIDIYEGLLNAVVIWKKSNVENIGVALRLAFAILHRDWSRTHSLLLLFQALIPKPIPALEPQALDIFELLIEFGAEQEVLTDWYNRWIGYLLDLPSARTPDMLQAWRRVGTWLRVAPELLKRLDTLLNDVQPNEASSHPISMLPKHFQISMFTLRLESAKAAASVLQGYNFDLKIRICDEKDMNATVEAIASHADMVVIVSTCISHAIFYGIKPLIESRKIIYPASAGTTSILRAITEGARNVLYSGSQVG